MNECSWCGVSMSKRILGYDTEGFSMWEPFCSDSCEMTSMVFKDENPKKKLDVINMVENLPILSAIFTQEAIDEFVATIRDGHTFMKGERKGTRLLEQKCVADLIA
tara:strand:- start:304 stop:621 length:318 start_codon:yes stop_codon:yes gene_type:complete